MQRRLYLVPIHPPVKAWWIYIAIPTPAHYAKAISSRLFPVRQFIMHVRPRPGGPFDATTRASRLLSAVVSHPNVTARSRAERDPFVSLVLCCAKKFSPFLFFLAPSLPPSRPVLDRDWDAAGFQQTEYRVIVTGLPPSASWQDLKDHMRKAGEPTYTDVVS